MRTLQLIRRETSDEGTFGQILGIGKTIFTGELPWRDNARSISCIPPGIYTDIWFLSPRFKRYTYRSLNVPNRDGILIHPANLMGDLGKGYKCQLNGCIALGERLGWINKQKALLISRPAVSYLESVMNKEPFKLEIINGYS